MGGVASGFAMLLGLFAVFAAPAGAANGLHPPLPALSHEGLSYACGDTTDSRGNLYVADFNEKKVHVYAAEGNAEFSPGAQITSFETIANAEKPCGLAVDAAGDVYVTGWHSDVVKYKPSAFPPTGTTTYAPDTAVNGTGTLVAASQKATGVAVDPETQGIYVAISPINEQQTLAFAGMVDNADKFTLTCDGETTAEITYRSSTSLRNTNIKNALVNKCGPNFIVSLATSQITYQGKYTGQDVPLTTCTVTVGTGTCTPAELTLGASTHVSSFQPNGTPISSTIGTELIAGSSFYGVDVYGETGNVFVADPLHNKAYVLNPAGSSILHEIDGSGSAAGAFTAMVEPYLAVDQSSGHVLVSDIPGHGVVDEFTETGAFVTQISHEPALEEAGPSDITIDNGTASPNQGNVYVTSAGGKVYAFGPLPGKKPQYPLTVKKLGGGDGTVTSTPAGIDCGSTCEAEFPEGKKVKLLAEPAAPGSVFEEWSGECNVVSDNKCEVTVDGAKEVSARFESQPVISEEAASQITDSSALLDAKVNPKGKATKYQFEYTSEEAWEAEGFTGATKAPSSAIEIGGGTNPLAVAFKAEGLESSTGYRFRVVATNAIGTAEGERDPETDVEIEHSFTTYSPPDVPMPCPNDSFRSGPSADLPDCRAYEQTSPVDKNGASVQAMAGATRTPEDGSAVTFEATSGIPGGEGAQNFPTYMAHRGTDGWLTTGLLPSPSSGQIAAVLGWSADFATVFDRARDLSTGSAMLARSVGDGTEAEIVPHTGESSLPAYNYVNSSADDETTVFESQPEESSNTTQKLTDDAAPGKPNVYAWDSQTKELRLAGVLPDGTTPPGGSRVGRGMDADEYNRDSGAVSEGGDAFFNADDSEGQLYLRLNPSEEETDEFDEDGNCIPDPVLACTIHVSATQKTNGKGAEWAPGARGDAAGPQPAYLRAASPDGKTITFTSSEKLTDKANTGIEPDAPAIAKADVVEPPCSLVSPIPCEKKLDFIPAFAHEIAVDEAEGYVYWSDPEHSRIGRATLDGTVVDENYRPLPEVEHEKEPGIVVLAPARPEGVAVVDEGSAKYIFWIDRGELDEKGKPQAGLGTIGRVDLDGNNLKTCYSGLTNPRSIAANASYVYWTMPQAGNVNGNLGRAETGCNPASVNFNILINSLASGDVALDAGHVYISKLTSASSSLIYRCPPEGGACGTAVVTVNGTTVAPGIAVDAGHIYWTDSTDNRIGRSNLDGTSPEETFITEAGRPGDLARGGERLLWTAFQGVQPNPGTDLYQLDRESGELTDLAPDSTDENGTEVQGVLGASEDGSYVYFAANGVPDKLANSTNAAGESAEPGNCENGNPATKALATGMCNLYLAHGGEVEFIARLDAKQPSGEKDSGDSVDWALGASDIEQRQQARSARVSAGGQVLVFRSSRELTDYDNQGPRCVKGSGLFERAPGPCLEFYRFEAGNLDLVCLTCSPRGATPEGPARLGSVEAPGFVPPQPAATLARNLSRDGSRFFFETPDALSVADTNGQDGCPALGSAKQKALSRACQDVYEWEAPGTGSCEEDSAAYSPSNEGCIYLLSTGKGKEASFFADADAEGDNVFIFTYQQLVPQDKDALFDAYDVRVGGGLASQHVTEAEPCQGEGCKPQSVPAPATQSPGSAGFAGPGDQAPGKTAKKHHRKRKHHNHRQKRRGKKRRAAKQNGRAGR